MNDALYRWPEEARVAGTGRVVPKTKFYEHANVPASLKAKFVDEVQRINWKFKLSTDTIALRSNSDVPEIQVFSIEAKDRDLSPAVLAAIDKAVPKPILFEIARRSGDNQEIRMVAAYKPVGRPNPKPSDYHSTGWLPAGHERAVLPPALDLPGLYDQVISSLLTVPTRESESIETALVRMAEVRRLEKEATRLEKKMRTEPQFNRKVELRRELKAKQAELASLNEPTNPS